jgi:hypothetical protein
MKGRHAAALTLASWYLMSPPVIRAARAPSRVNPAAHLKYWKITGTYTSLTACDVAGRALLKSARDNSASIPDDLVDLSPFELNEALQNLQCISNDDPRLSG